MAPPSPPPAAILADYAFGFAKGKVIYAGVESGLLDVFAKRGEPMAPDDAAEAAGTNCDATLRLIRALSGLGVLDETREGTYSLSPMGQLLASDKETGKLSPQAGTILSMNKPLTWNTWSNLTRTVKEGGTGWEKTPESEAFPSIFEYYQAHPEAQAVFDSAMSGVSAAEIPLLLKAYDGFQDMDTLMDVGGGHGSVMAAVTAQHPHIKGINFDMPHVVQTAPSIRGVEHVGGDMFKAETLPKVANIIMKHILHDWGDDACARILASCHAVLPAGGRLLVVDAVIPDPGTTPREARQFMTLLDIQMMMMTAAGRERSEREWRALLESAGFEVRRIVPLAPGRPSVLEAVKA